MILINVMFLFMFKQSLLAYSIIFLLFCMLIWIWFGTGYKLKEGVLIIRSGPFVKKVDIKEIKKVESSNISTFAISYISGPSLSTDRIKIVYGKIHDTVSISPSNKKKFLSILASENTDVKMF